METKKRENPNWNPNWLVVADKDDDPIVVVTNEENSPVFASYETSPLFPIDNSCGRYGITLLDKYHRRLTYDEVTPEIVVSIGGDGTLLQLEKIHHRRIRSRRIAPNHLKKLVNLLKRLRVRVKFKLVVENFQ